MKAQISYLKDKKLWRLIYYRPTEQGLRATAHYFQYPDGAISLWNTISAQVIREQKAYSKLYYINLRLLDIREGVFIRGLLKTKCLNITKRQYGYLSGLYERKSLVRN